MEGGLVTVIRPPGTDRYGDPVPGEGSQHEVSDCRWAPRVGGSGSSSRDILSRGRQGVIEGLTLYAPPGADILHTDRIDVPGQGEFEVDGDVGAWEDAGIEVALRRGEG